MLLNSRHSRQKFYSSGMFTFGDQWVGWERKDGLTSHAVRRVLEVAIRYLSDVVSTAIRHHVRI